MDQRSIRPGMRAASLAGKVHPRTGEPLEPIGYLSDGTPLWPVMGGAPDDDDENDPDFTGDEDEDDEDDEDDDSSDDDDSDKDSKSKKDKKKSKDEDEDDDKPKYTEEEMYAVKRRMRKADQRASRLEQELRDIKAQLSKKSKKSTKDDDSEDDKAGVDTEELTRVRRDNDKLRQQLQSMRVETAFSRIPLPKGEEWIDLEDAIAAAQRLELLEDVIDEDGTVDKRSLRAALKELRRRKPHLIKKVSEPDEDEDEEDEEGQRPKTRRTASKMNGKRKGDRGTGTTREALAKKFPALNRA